MAACLGNRVDGFGAQLVRHLAQVGFRQRAQIGRAVDAIEKRRFGNVAQVYPRPQPVPSGTPGSSVATVYNEPRRLTQKVGLFIK
jgi:hypothetical protein